MKIIFLAATKWPAQGPLMSVCSVCVYHQNASALSPFISAIKLGSL